MVLEGSGGEEQKWAIFGCPGIHLQERGSLRRRAGGAGCGLPSAGGPVGRGGQEVSRGEGQRRSCRKGRGQEVQALAWGWGSEEERRCRRGQRGEDHRRRETGQLARAGAADGQEGRCGAADSTPGVGERDCGHSWGKAGQSGQGTGEPSAPTQVQQGAKRKVEPDRQSPASRQRRLLEAVWAWR